MGLAGDIASPEDAILPALAAEGYIDLYVSRSRQRLHFRVTGDEFVYTEEYHRAGDGGPRNGFWYRSRPIANLFRRRFDATLCAGLVFSLLGDVFLMLPSNRFTAGLASFLVAHLLYVVAFVRDAGFGAAPLALVVLLLSAGALVAKLWPRLGRLRGPVLAYMAAIVTMAWQGSARWESVGQLGALFACVGAWLFVASDAALAWNRFGRPFAASPLVVLSTYFVGQLLLALSTGVGEALVDWAVR